MNRRMLLAATGALAIPAAARAQACAVHQGRDQRLALRPPRVPQSEQYR